MTIENNRGFRRAFLRSSFAGAWFAVLACAMMLPTAARAAAPATAAKPASGRVAKQTGDEARLRAIGLRLAAANADRCQRAAPAATPSPDAPSIAASSIALPARPARNRCQNRLIVSSARQLNAWADGRDIAVTGRMVRFAAEDDALAFVVAHEMAHNILGHAERLRGISSQFAGPADAARIKDTEIEADALAVALVTRAGFDPAAAERLLLKMGKRSPAQLPATYPSMAERIALVKAVTASLAHAH